jgi:hypothetical protein
LWWLLLFVVVVVSFLLAVIATACLVGWVYAMWFDPFAIVLALLLAVKALRSKSLSHSGAVSALCMYLFELPSNSVSHNGSCWNLFGMHGRYARLCDSGRVLLQFIAIDQDRSPAQISNRGRL